MTLPRLKRYGQLSQRTAYWLDYNDPYVTYSNNYVESVWWALRTLHEKGLLSRGHKILPYCARCGTALSSHEVAQGYEDVEDPSVYIALDLLDANGQPTPGVRRRILVWTTTPWTLVSNTAVHCPRRGPVMSLSRCRRSGSSPPITWRSPSRWQRT